MTKASKKIKMRFTKKGKYPATFSLPGTPEMPGPKFDLHEGDVFELSERHAAFDWWIPVDAKDRRRLNRKYNKIRKARIAKGGQISDLATDPESLSPNDALVLGGAMLQNPRRS